MPSSPVPSALEFFPPRINYERLAEASLTCQGCELYKLGTQTVFGEGPRDARVMMVGEQPGNEEDLQGHPFVGPAGRMLDKALVDARIDRSTVYLTNAVKHFKWKPAGKRRLHQKPSTSEVNACKPWLQGEIEVIHPEIIVCLGATAAQSLLGNKFRVTKSRGEWFDHDGSRIIATIHPSAILRAPGEGRELEYRRFVADLAIVARAVA
ncbi:MAG: UdgX family uracil-DNA binding protein [Acidobacteria bacterium]|nr:UdgX family uracil-DNA binding protein [Acidobacteriota bacterium]